MSEPIWVRGDKLSSEARRQALASFAFRWTSDSPHRAAAYGLCPHCRVRGGAPSSHPLSKKAGLCLDRHPIIPFQTDEEWLATHEFAVTRRGALAARVRFCQPHYGDIAK
jgi:hypothetical protein